MWNRVWQIAFVCIALCLVACVEGDVRRGNEALRIGDYDRAIANFSKALDQDPVHRDARYGLALSYFSVAEEGERLHIPTFDLWKRAADEFRILSKIDSGAQVDANHSTCLFYLARAAMAKGESANVLSLLDQSIQLDSANYFSLNLKGLILAGSDDAEDVERAKQIFIHIVTSEPQFISAYVNLGNIYWNEGDIESAWDTWSMGLMKSPSHPALLRWTKIAEDSLKSKVLSGEL
jgi:tetratricopeptide (TPR) repeat protein